MKNIFVFLIPVLLTVVIIFLPTYYFNKNDEMYMADAVEKDINVKAIGELGVNKLIEIAASENSKYISPDVEPEESAYLENGLEVIEQLGEIMQMEIPDKNSLVKNAVYNRKQVIGNSDYNSYVFTLSSWTFLMDNMELYVVYLPDNDKILSAFCFSFDEAAGYFIEKSQGLDKRLDKYYGSDNWSMEVFESEILFYQGHNRVDIEKIQTKMWYVEGKIEIYN